jgi:hypothetical protein
MKGTHRLTVRYRPFEPQLSTKGTGLPVPQKRDDGRLQPLRYVFRDAESKNVPQALKHSFVRPCAARVNPCPSLESRAAHRQQRTTFRRNRKESSLPVHALDLVKDGLPGFLNECVEAEAAILIASCAHGHPG